MQRRVNSWNTAAGPVIDSDSVRDLLHLGPLDLAGMLNAGAVAAVRDVGGGSAWFPEWQFDGEARRVRPAVPDIVRAFRHSANTTDGPRDVDLLIASWAYTAGVQELGGLSPAEWMSQGRPDGLLMEAAGRAARSMSPRS